MPLEQKFGPIRIKAIAAGEGGEGWHSPCPQLYIDIDRPNTGAAILGAQYIAIIRLMCDHAISSGDGIFDRIREQEKAENEGDGNKS